LGFAFEYHAASGTVRWSLEGRVSDELFWESLKALGEVLAKVPAKKGIVDFSGVTRFEVSNRAIHDLAAASPFMPAQFPRVVVASGDHVYGVARMFGMLSEETRNLEVVRTMEEAYKLLDLTAPKFRAIGMKKRAKV
jgi:hypothetical protein